MESLLVTLAQQEALLTKQQENLAGRTDSEPKDPDSSLDSSLVTPDSDSLGANSRPDSTTQSQARSSSDPEELLRLKRELEDAKHRIARMDMELSQNRITQHTIEQGLGSPSEADFRVPMPLDVSEQTITNLQGALNASTRGPVARQTSWATPEAGLPDVNDAPPVGPFGRPLDIWGHPPARPGRPGFQSNLPPAINVQTSGHSIGWGHNATGPTPTFSMGTPMLPAPQQQRAVSGPHFQGLGGHGRGMNELSAFPTSQPPRRSQTQVGRAGPSSYGQRASGWGTYPNNYSVGDNLASQTNPYQSSHLLPPTNNYQPAPIGTPLSPTAPEFTSSAGQGNPWYTQQVSDNPNQ